MTIVHYQIVVCSNKTNVMVIQLKLLKTTIDLDVCILNKTQNVSFSQKIKGNLIFQKTK